MLPNFFLPKNYSGDVSRSLLPVVLNPEVHMPPSSQESAALKHFCHVLSKKPVVIYFISSRFY